MSGGSTVKRAGRRGRRPSKVDVKVKLERSRQSARECRARKKLRYQYLEELVNNRERAVYALRSELDQFKEWCQAIDKREIPEGLKKALAALPSPLQLAPAPNSKPAVSQIAEHETTSGILVDAQGEPQECAKSIPMAKENPDIPTVVNIYNRVYPGVRRQDRGHTRQTRPKHAESSEIETTPSHSAIPTIVSSYRVKDNKVSKQGKSRRSKNFQRQMLSTSAHASMETQPQEAPTELTNNSTFYQRTHPKEEDIAGEWTHHKKQKSSHVSQKVAPDAVPMTEVWSEPTFFMPTSLCPIPSTSTPGFTAMLNSNGIEDSGHRALDVSQSVPLDAQKLLSTTEFLLGGSSIWSERASPPTSSIYSSPAISPANNSIGTEVSSVWPPNKSTESFLVQPNFVTNTEPMITWPETTISLPMPSSDTSNILTSTAKNINRIEVPGVWKQDQEQDIFSLHQ